MILEQVFGAEDEEPRSSLGSNTVHLSQPPPEHMEVDVGAREESEAKGQYSEYTQGETPVSIVAEEPNLEVLRGVFKLRVLQKCSHKNAISQFCKFKTSL
jgi:hypothetical protein